MKLIEFDMLGIKWTDGWPINLKISYNAGTRAVKSKFVQVTKLIVVSVMSKLRHLLR